MCVRGRGGTEGGGRGRPGTVEESRGLWGKGRGRHE